MTFRIKNWLEYQHYGDRRNPPWIKLHYEIMNGRTWVMLDDASRCLMIACMLIASRNKGQVPNDAEYLKRVAFLKKVDFKPLLDIGFLEPLDDASILLADAIPSLSLSSSNSISGKGVKGEKPGPEGFADFFSNFPKQRIGSRDTSIRAYKVALTKVSASELLAACLAYGKSSDVERGYAKGCAAWLNDEGWNNDYSIRVQQKPNKPDDYYTTILKSTQRAMEAQDDIGFD